MSRRRVTDKKMFEAWERYGALIDLHAGMFLQDQTKVDKVTNIMKWKVPLIVKNAKNTGGSVSAILRYVRFTCLQVLKDDPLFNPWEPWKKEPVFFQLLSEHKTAYYKELFWYSFYRDIPDREVAEYFGTTPYEVKGIVRAMFAEIGAGMSRFLQQQGNG